MCRGFFLLLLYDTGKVLFDAVKLDLVLRLQLLLPGDDGGADLFGHMKIKGRGRCGEAEADLAAPRGEWLAGTTSALVR